MMAGRIFAILFSLAAATLLSGCVAAAIPVLAAGGLAKTRMDDNRPQHRETVATLPGDRQTAVTPDPAPVLISGAARLTSLTELPAPTGSAGAPPATGQITAFADYATRQAAIPVIGGERRSALLSDPGRMVPDTRECSVHPAAVLIDIDPTDTSLDLSRPLTGNAELGASLAALRAEGVVIGWTSNKTADQAGAIRKALQASGLDPAGRDDLVLLRFPEERKQTRRADFAKAHCVVAIAGDARTDFDELYEYLRDPAIAAPLDSLVGAGWFIVPAPLTPN